MTAESPISDPTERSMPPVTMIGVSARARRPSSTASLVISKKLPTVANRSPTIENTTISAPRSAASTASLFRERAALMPSRPRLRRAADPRVRRW